MHYCARHPLVLLHRALGQAEQHFDGAFTYGRERNILSSSDRACM
jgi:hypothetical protein